MADKISKSIIGKSCTSTTDNAGNVNIGNVTSLVGRYNVISITVQSPGSTWARLYTYSNILFAGFFDNNNNRVANTEVEYTLWYKP